MIGTYIKHQGNCFKTDYDLLHFRQALRNFEKCVKPGGLLLIDHRNYDDIIDTGRTASKCIYYNVSMTITFLQLVFVTIDYFFRVNTLQTLKHQYCM